MAASSERPLDHRYRNEHPVRTLGYLFHADRRHLIAAVGVFTVKHSPIWLLSLITASMIDTVVQHQPIERLWLSTGIILLTLLVNYPLHLLDVRLLYGSVRRMGTTLGSALCTRMQQLSIGYHSRVSGGVLEAKVVRDMETVEQMVQQTAESGIGSPTAWTRPTRKRCARPCGTPTRWSSSTGCRRARTPWSASAAPASRAGSASGWPSPAP